MATNNFRGHAPTTSFKGFFKTSAKFLTSTEIFLLQTHQIIEPRFSPVDFVQALILQKPQSARHRILPLRRRPFYLFILVRAGVPNRFTELWPLPPEINSLFHCACMF